jgi:hypothetical protein
LDSNASEWSQNSVEDYTDWVMGWTIRGLNPGTGKRVLFLILPNVQTGYGNPEIKRPVREVNHSPVSSAKVKNEWSHTSTPPYMTSRRGQGQLRVFRRFRKIAKSDY